MRSLSMAEQRPAVAVGSNDHLDLAVADAGTPRAVGPPPAAAVARRIAARHADRQTQRRKHRPHPLPLPASRPPPDRVQLVHQRHQATEAVQPTSTSPVPSAASTRCTGTPPPRTAPAAAAPRLPRPSSPRGTRRRRPPRSRTVRGHARSRANDVQASLPCSNRGPGPPPLPFGSPEHSGLATLRTGNREAHRPLPFDDAGVAASSASCNASASSAAASRSSGSNRRLTMQRSVIVPSASGARRMAAGAAFPVPRCPRERERPRMSRASSVERSASIGAMTLHLNCWQNHGSPKRPAARPDSLRVVPTRLGKSGEQTRILGIHDDPQTPRNLPEALVPPVTPGS